MADGLARARKRLSDVLPLRNPIVVASGPLGRDAKGLITYGEYAGAVVGKSITYLPQEGNPPPRIANLGSFGLINWENCPNVGYEQYCEEIRIAKRECDCAIVASLAPSSNVEQLKTMAAAFESAGADAVELDFKWGFDPATGRVGYAPGEARQAGFESETILNTVTHLRKTVSMPIFAKLIGQGSLEDNARAAESAGADGITAINSIFPAMKVDLKKHRPALSSRFGGLSGKSILPLAVAAVYRIYEAVDIPIFGCGGVTCGADALELIMAGAQAVQAITIAMAEGPEAFDRINGELTDLVSELGYASVDECCGIAHV
jgi:dihydroorotate dehydrogenase (NAD+) catalytic subunit